MITEVYTSYFANIRNLPEDVIPVSISQKPPEGYKGLQYKKLAPPSDLIAAYKRKKDESSYIRQYNERILSVLNTYAVLKELDALVPGEEKKIALVCYEKPGDFCHRNLIARWFRNIRVPVQEYKA